MNKLLRLLKRWYNMLLGKSSFHVEQGKGKCYSLNELRGYYNDLTNKVTDKTVLDKNGIPINTTITGLETYFPISIFQYGLGLYDLYIIDSDDKYREDFMKIANWAVENIDSDGMWDCMSKLNDTAHCTQSSMCQSEGVSVLLRAYKETNDRKYYDVATKAINFMIKDVKDGGTCFYENNKPIFQEYVSKYNLTVLNGWIFSVFGLFDYTLINDSEKYKTILKQTIMAMIEKLNLYDRGFWSDYDLKGTIASPAYHDLHIKQLVLLYEMFGNQEFKKYADKWQNYQNLRRKKILSMFIKLKQKFFKSKYYDINTTLVR
ncbi:MAG TPA: thioredoxin [Clostridiales bacterium]|nr:thioredoxin [Clostridiales bacterium]